MTFAKTTLAAAALAAAGAIAAPAAQAAECGTDETIQVAEMTWESAAMLAHVTARILEDGYGCNVEIVPGDTVPTATSMLTKGEPHIAPEMWLTTLKDVWDKILESGNAYKASDVFSNGGGEGWWIPDYVAEANPGLRHIDDLIEYKELFMEPASGDRGRLYACPPGWGCEITNNALYAALSAQKDFDEHYELFSPGSGANLQAAIARAVARQEPILTYYWEPTSVIGRYNLVKLEMPAYDEEIFRCLSNTDCETTEVSAFPSAEVIVAVASEIKEIAPDVAEFLSNLQVSNADMNAILAWADEHADGTEDMAAYFFENYEEVWSSWIPAEAAERVKAAM